MPSQITRLKSIFPGLDLRPTPPAVVTETPAERVERQVAQVKQQLDRSRRRPAPSTDERVPRSYSAGIPRVWFLPYLDSTTKDSPEIRAALRLMRRDAFVKAASEPQIAAVASEDWQVQASESGNAEAEEQAQFVTRTFHDYLAGGMPALVRAVCAPLMSDGFTLGEKVWEVAERGRLEGKIVFRAAKAKDPDYLRVEGDRFGNVTHVTSTREPGAVFPITDFLYARYLTVFDEPLGEAAFRPAYAPYWMLDTVKKLRVVHHEKRMAGLLLGTYQDDDDKGPLEDALALAKTSTWLAVPEGTRVEAVALSTASEPDYKSFYESLRDEVFTGIAFATLQSMTANAPGGLRGDSEVQKQTADLGPWLLMSIVTQVVNEQLIPDLIDFNFPYPAAGSYPKLTFGAVSNAELLELVQIVEAAQRIGLKPSRKHYAGALSIKEADPNDPDDQLQGAGAQPAAPPGGGFGMGGGFGAPDPFAAGGGAMFSEGWSSFAWQPARSTTGNVKAVGTAEDAGRVLYGRQAESALARQGRADRGEPQPELPQQRAQRLAREREPARAEARDLFARALQNPAALTPDAVRSLGARLSDLTQGELRGLANNLAVVSGGLKPDLVARLVAHARRGTTDLPAAAAPPAGDVRGAGDQPARLTAAPAWVTGDPPLAAVADAYRTATGKARRVMETALDNAGWLARDPATDAVTGWATPSPGRSLDREPAHQVAAGLASGHRWLAESGGTPEELAHVERALEAAGAERVGEPGEAVPFDGAVHGAYPGVFTGHPVRVVHPGWQVPTDADRKVVEVKAKVEPSAPVKAQVERA